MAVIETWLRQDLKGLVTVRSLQGQVFSLDNGGNLIGVKVTKDGQPVELEGTVIGYCILSDGQTVNVTGDGSSGIQNGNEAYIVLPQLVYSVPGQISIVIKLTSGSVTTTLAACTGYVYRSRTSNEVVPPGTPIPDLATMEEVIRMATEATDAANAATVGAEKVDASMTKEGDVITIAVTDRGGNVTEETVTDQTEAMKRKADIDGYYEELAVGTADQLVSTEAVTDTTPYLYRKSGGSVDIGNRETLEKIVGGTVAWNQLQPIENISFAKNNVDELSISFDNGVLNVTGTQTASGYGTIGLAVSGAWKTVPANHILLIMASNYSGFQLMRIGHGGTAKRAYAIINKSNIDYAPYATVRIEQGETVDIHSKFCSFDLTAMFGPTIADYVYNLEQANAGDGVAWFRKLFPKDYYSYNPGELISVKPSSHDMVGFNLWDEEWEKGSIQNNGTNYASNVNIRSKNYIPVIKGNQYFVSAPAMYSIYVFFYNSDKRFVRRQQRVSNGGADAMFVPEGSETFVRFYVQDTYGTTYKNDICINLSHSGSRNGEYEPYEKHSYPLADVELRGLIAIDADGKLVYSGDEYTPDGNVARKYELLNLGEQTWSYDSNKDRWLSTAISGIKTCGGSVLANLIASNFVTYTNNYLYDNVSIKGIAVNNNILVVRNGSSTDSPTGSVIYELVTPTTEEVAPYTPVQVVDDWGTEEFVDTREVAIPVGHSTSYMANLRDKLQHLPSLADEDGDYIIKQTGAKMELAKLSSSGLAQSIYESIESAPVVSFADGADGQAMKAVNVAIEPVQDLHGYDAPWPGGGRKNLLPKPTGTSVTEAGVVWTVNDDGSIKVSGTATERSLFYYTKNNNIIVNNVKPVYATGSLNGNQLGSGVLVDGVWKNFSTVASISGSIEQVWFDVPSGATVNGVIYPMLVASSETDLSWTPYSNICPITGFDSVKVTRTGKNLLVRSSATTEKYLNSSGEAVNSPASAGGDYWSISDYIPVDGNITISGILTAGNAPYSAWYDDSFTYISSFKQVNNTFTPPAGAKYMRISFYSTDEAIQIEYGSSASAHESHQGQTYEVTFPTEAGTVYGGTLDVVRGKLVVDRAKRVIDGTVSFWSYSSNETYAHMQISAPDSMMSQGQIMCDKLRFNGAKPYYKEGEGVWQGGSYSWYICVKKDLLESDDSAGFIQWLTNNNLTCIYKLATPQTYTLTPKEIKALLGANNIWSDAGNTAVTYPADTKLYIDNKIAELQALILENNG